MDEGGKSILSRPRGQTKSKTPASFGLVFQTASSRLQAYKQLPGKLNDTRLLIQDCHGASQPDGPWQAGAGGFNILNMTDGMF